jgi:3'-5' exoribonuclease
MTCKPAPVLAAETRPQPWVGSVSRGDAVDGVFLLRRLELRQTRGVTYLSAELSDRTGSIAARLWQPGISLLERLRSTPYAHATGTVKRCEPDPQDARAEHELQVDLQTLAPAHAADAVLRDLHEHTPADPDALLASLRATFLSEVEDVHVRTLLVSFLDDPALVAKLRTAPAASSFHHSYVGGLIEHIHSLAGVALNMCAAYPRLDRGLMLAGVFLHDVGKIDELSWERGLQYTDRGQLVGHIGIGLLLLEEKIRAIPGFPAQLRDVLGHLILSHHGTKEFGSPVLPVTPEAFAVHAIDNLDGKLWSAWRAIDDPRGEPGWTAHNRHLGRKLYRGGGEEAAPH